MFELDLSVDEAPAGRAVLCGATGIYATVVELLSLYAADCAVQLDEQRQAAYSKPS